MIADENLRIRERAMQIILSTRRRSTSKIPRKFVKPQQTLNLNAKHYWELVDLNRLKAQITEPPLTMSFSYHDLKCALRANKILPIPDIPNNTQAVERMVKLVTEASSKVLGHENRHYFILNSLHSRALMNVSEQKSNFLSKID